MTKTELLREVRRLQRRLRRLETDLERERGARERKIEAVRRGADRRVAGVMRELMALRHHEARAAQLERLLAERTPEDPAES